MQSLLTPIISILVASTLSASAAGNDWMSCLNGALPLSQFSIPGTHDSAALVEPFPGTARTQSFPIDQQLAFGVRFLDIRCNHTNNQFAIFHGFVPQGITFDVVLLQVLGFLDANPGETVIMSVKEEFDPSNNTRSFEETFDSYVAQNPSRWLLGDATPTLEEARNKIVLFRRFGAVSTPKGIDASSFPDNTAFSTGNRLRVQDRYVVTNNDDKWDAIHSLLGEAKYGGPNTLYVNFCSGYTPDEFGVPDILAVSDDINVRLTNFFTANTSGHFGTLLMDFADAAKSELIYSTNLETTSAVHRPAFFTIVNRHSGKAIDLIAGNSNNAAQINQWDHDAGQNQRWALAPTEDGNHFRITSWHSGRCFNIESNSNNPGAKLLSFENANSGTNPSQHFDLVDAGDGYFKIRNVQSNLILEVENSGTGNNARIQQNTDSGGNHQQWRLQPWGNYFIRTSSENYLTASGDPVVESPFEKHPRAEWKFASTSDGYLKVSVSTSPGKAITTADSNPGTAAALATGGSQDLQIIPKIDGTFKFRFVHSNLAWEASNNELQQNSESAAAAQDFELERLTDFASTTSSAEHDWRCEHFDISDIFDPAKEASVWGRDADPDGDGISNFEEFAFGSDPTNAAASPETDLDYQFDAANQRFVATFSRLRGNVLNYTLQTSTNLSAWSDANTTEHAVTEIDARYESAALIDTDATAPPKRRFVRIIASVPGE